MFMNRIGLICTLALVLTALSAASDSLQTHSSGQVVAINRDDAIQQFQNSLVGRGYLKRNRATGLVDFARLDRNAIGGLASSNTGGRKEKSLSFFNERRQAFGLVNPNEELNLVNEKQDRDGNSHLTFSQTYQGVPVFAGMLKTHFVHQAANENGSVALTITDLVYGEAESVDRRQCQILGRILFYSADYGCPPQTFASRVVFAPEKFPH